MRKQLLFFVLSIAQLFSYANSADKHSFDSSLVEDEKRISAKVAELIEVRFDDDKMLALAKEIEHDFKLVLQKEGAFNYPFDSLFPVGKVVSDDKLLRIFTWYAIKADGSHKHYGFIQYYSKAKKQVLLYPLIDKSDEIEEVETSSLTNENWYGATYYDIVQRKNQYGQLYVLLGWDGNTIFSNKKVLESLVFTESGRPKFGKPVFRSGRTKVKRIVFEYSRMASMMLKYNSDFDMIVMDHLSPSKPIYNRNRQFYGPDLSYDAFKFEDDFWVYYPSINYKPVLKKKRLNRR